MSVESLEQAIESTKKELERRPARKNIGTILITLIVFFIPVYLFFGQQDSVYQTGYAPLVVGWLMISVGIGHTLSTALFIGRTVELTLSLEIASNMLENTKQEKSDS